MQGLRLGFVISAFVNLLVNNLSYLLLFEVLAMVCDVVARLADALRLPKSKARVFAILADRVEIITLLGALLVGLQTAEGGYYEPNPVPRVKLALGLLLIEVLVSWAEVLVESLTTIKTVAATPFMNKADALVIQRGPYRKWLTQKILKKIPWFITSVSKSLFHCALYTDMYLNQNRLSFHIRSPLETTSTFSWPSLTWLMSKREKTLAS